MKNSGDTNPLLISITPTTVYISTNPDQSSYANFTVTVENGGSDILYVSSIAITLPPALAPSNALASITPVAGQPDLWNFSPSEFTLGEFDASPQSGSYVNLNGGDTWDFTLQMVTLVNTISQSSADVTAAVTFEDSTNYSVPLTVNIAPAVASIISFNSAPANINPGQTSMLNWQCEKIDYCIISPISDDHQNPTGTFDVSPGETTIYTLFAYGDGVILSDQWAISVDNAQIIKFGGSAGEISVDCGSNITLVWECNQFTESIALADNTGVTIPNLLTGNNTVQNGSVTLGPIAEPTTFIFTAYGNTPQNFDQRDAAININDVVYTLSANPDTGTWTGDNVTLTWNVESASAVSLSPAVTNGPSLQNLSGSVVVNPTADVTYILSVSGFISNAPVSDLQAPVSLTVEQVVINSFTISPDEITPDVGPNQGTLGWNTQAEVVSISNGVGSQPTTGTFLLNAPVNGTVYTLTAGTNLNPALQTAAVTVVNAYGPFTFNSMTPDGFLILGVDFIVPDPGAMYVLNQGLAGAYKPTITGVVATGTPPSEYAALAVWQQDDPSQSYFVITSYPYAKPAVTFQWADPNNQTGTITLAAFSNAADFINKLKDLK